LSDFIYEGIEHLVQRVDTCGAGEFEKPLSTTAGEVNGEIMSDHEWQRERRLREKKQNK
jgi:hypothetical protein